MALRTKESFVNYLNLTKIAIDMVTKVQDENTLGRGWNKLPNNRTDAKVKIKK